MPSLRTCSSHVQYTSASAQGTGDRADGRAGKRDAEKGIGVELLGPGELEGIGTIDLKITLSDGHEETWYLDAETYREFAIDTEVYDHTQLREPMRQRTFFDDFREVEGLVFPFQIEWEFWARLETMTIAKITLNPEIDDARFSPPPAAETTE